MPHDDASTPGARPAARDAYPGRRQIETLTEKDLAQTDAWWFPGPDGHLSGPDDQTVLPLDTSAATGDGAVEFPAGRFLLRAVFTLADGSPVTGHLTYAPDDGGGLREREPTLCTPHGQIPLWHGVLVPADDDVAAWLSWLGRPRGAVFPLTWRAAIHPPADDLGGAAAGFVVYVDGAVRALP